VSFVTVTDSIDIGECAGFWKTRKMESALPPSAVSTVHTSAAQHCRETHQAFMMIPSQMAFK